jgi:hypothetical protein
MRIKKFLCSLLSFFIILVGVGCIETIRGEFDGNLLAARTIGSAVSIAGMHDLGLLFKNDLSNAGIGSITYGPGGVLWICMIVFLVPACDGPHLPPFVVGTEEDKNEPTPFDERKDKIENYSWVYNISNRYDELKKRFPVYETIGGEMSPIDALDLRSFKYQKMLVRPFEVESRFMDFIAHRHEKLQEKGQSLYFVLQTKGEFSITVRDDGYAGRTLVDLFGEVLRWKFLNQVFH